MNIIEKQIVNYYHQHRVNQEQYSDAQKQGWVNESVQKIRFNAFSDLVDFNNKSVLDVGCGYGDFKNYLNQHCTRFDYIGIDQQAEFIAKAKTKFKQEQGVWFYHADVSSCQLPSMDIVVASGLLSYKSEQYGYYENIIAKLFEAADEALVFNMLDKQKFKSSDLIIAHDKEKILKYCNSLSKNVSIKEDYMDIDFTICMKK